MIYTSTRKDLHVGQEVKVLSHGNKVIELTGVITRVGRTLVTIKTGDGWNGEANYRMDGGGENVDFGARYFRTLEQYEDEQTREQTLAYLKGKGIQWQGWTTNHLSTAIMVELAEVFRKHDET